MSLDRSQGVGPIAVILGVVGLGSFVSLMVFFVVGGPFGAINDVGNGALGLLSGVLAWSLWRRGVAAGSGIVVLASSVATLGAAITVVGSALILSDSTGFFLAGLVSSVGFAMIGVWLIALNRWIASAAGQQWPGRLLKLGILAGAVMAVGFINAPGIAMGLDDMDTAPGWILVGNLSWLGTFILFPIWSIWFGRVLSRPVDRRPPAVAEDGRQAE